MKPTMKKWLTGLLSAALLAGNLPVYAVNTAYAAEEDGFFTDEAESFEGSLEEPEENPDGGQSEDSFASVSEFTGFTSGEAEEDFSGEEDFVAPDSQDGFEGEAPGRRAGCLPDGKSVCLCAGPGLRDARGRRGDLPGRLLPPPDAEHKGPHDGAQRGADRG